MVRASGWLVGNELKERKYNLMKGASCGGKTKNRWTRTWKSKWGTIDKLKV